MLKLSSNRKALIAGAAVLGLLGAGGLYLTLSPSAS